MNLRLLIGPSHLGHVLSRDSSLPHPNIANRCWSAATSTITNAEAAGGKEAGGGGGENMGNEDASFEFLLHGSNPFCSFQGSIGRFDSGKHEFETNTGQVHLRLVAATSHQLFTFLVGLFVCFSFVRFSFSVRWSIY